jgi:hypothetical protein
MGGAHVNGGRAVMSFKWSRIWQDGVFFELDAKPQIDDLIGTCSVRSDTCVLPDGKVVVLLWNESAGIKEPLGDR